MNTRPCLQCGALTPMAICAPCCRAMRRTNLLDDWDAIPASERGDTSRELTDAVIRTMEAMMPEPEEDQP